MTTTNENLISTLKLAGLRDSEAKIYLVCLELGPSSAWNIYLKSGIKRPTCYAILDELVGEGIAAKNSDGQRTIFSVVSPTELLLKLESKKNQFKESLPLFDAVASKSAGKPKIRVYEGIEGVRQAYLLSHAQPEESVVLVLGSPDIWYKHSEANRAYIADRMVRRIHLKMILPDLPKNKVSLKDDKKELRETRFLPPVKYSPKVETQIFGDTVIFIAHSEKEPFATVIENAAIAHDERERFLALWNLAKIERITV